MMTAAEWWLLTVLLWVHIGGPGPVKWNQADKMFVREMVNELSLSEDAMPTPAQQRWLLSIKREVDRREGTKGRK